MASKLNSKERMTADPPGRGPSKTGFKDMNRPRKPSLRPDAALMEQLLGGMDVGGAGDISQIEPIVELIMAQIMGDTPQSIGKNDPDPYNDNPNLQPATMEDDPDAYWDAEHMGNGTGGSSVAGPPIPKGQPGWDTPAGDGKRYNADPVGNGPDPELIAQLLAGLGLGR